jgi:hypothetical protein
VKNLTVIRTGATVLISVAVAMQTLYPSFTWIGILVAAASAVGIHAIPAVSQAATVAIPMVTTEVKKMADDSAPELSNPVGVSGNVLMGVNPPVTAQKTEEKPVETVEKSDSSPDAAPSVTVVPAPEAAPVPVSEPTPPPAADVPVTAQKTASAPSAVTVTPADRNELADLVRAAADALNSVAEKLAN